MRRQRHGSILATLLAVMSTPALAQSYERGGWMWGPGHNWTHMLFGGFMMLLLWGGLVVLIVILVRWVSRSEHPDRPRTVERSDALETLKQRYARGEIDREEYEEKRRVLLE